MTKEEIFNYFYTNSANLGIKMTLFIMFAALIIAGIIFATYYMTYKGVAYNNTFNISLVLILLISVVIMLMISSNIVISLGMVGALSIVRFRTAIKDSRDTVFIFWAISEGLCVGSQNFKLALVTTLVISLVILITNFIPKYFNKYLLIITGEEQTINNTNLIKKINSFVLSSKLRTANKNKEHQEMIFEVRTKGELDLNIIDELLKVKGVKSVNWVIESGETVG